MNAPHGTPDDDPFATGGHGRFLDGGIAPPSSAPPRPTTSRRPSAPSPSATTANPRPRRSRRRARARRRSRASSAGCSAADHPPGRCPAPGPAGRLPRVDGGLLDAWAQWWAGKDTKDLTLAGVRLLWWGRGGKLLQFAGGLTVAIDLIGEARLRLWLDAARARSADALSRFRELPQVLADVHAARLARYRRFVTPLWFAITALCVWWLLDTAGPGWPIYSWVVAVAAALGTVLTFRDRPGGPR
ncbi:hypothetical protein ACFQV2_28130 [Actinokineospora soli]|uniref:Uncharacterized protein n=1 Tax=Actinokineospora soli TaxID=1048753 RepID=A0ABW2TSL4_9PSEU